MLEALQSCDLWFFMFINMTISNVVTDFIMPIVTSDMLLRIAYALSMFSLLIFGSKRTKWLVLTSLFALLLADQISSHLLKPLIERPRPCHTLSHINLLVNCGAGWSMPSSHSANAFAQAILFAVTIPRTKIWLLPLATLIAISRVFVGVHYPLDVIVGSILGGVIGWIVARLFLQLRPEVTINTPNEMGE